MSDNGLRNRCRINTNTKTDTFVGISCENNDFVINFPLGFSLADDDRTLRREIMLLLSTISTTTKQMESKVRQQGQQFFEEGFPFQAYLYVLADYFQRGIYKEREEQFQVSRRGKIDWAKTIKTQRPFIKGSRAYYLDYVTRKNQIRDNEMISLIHEYCVYDSMRKIGWLYTSIKPIHPRIKLNKKLFKTILLSKLDTTFNDKNRALFMNMLAIIDFLQDDDASINYKCGTNRFEYVWEAVIDRVFGISGKNIYFPKTTWNLKDLSYNNACLEPDTVMIAHGNVYILDAKYYKYGATKNPWDLPESTSINKQITYGEYVAEEEKFKKIHGEGFKTYNAFLMPFNMNDWESAEKMIPVGTATSDWKFGQKEYETVLGVLVDVKYLMQISVRENYEAIERLADLIQKQFE